jgi:hypothetical protein
MPEPDSPVVEDATLIANPGAVVGGRPDRPGQLMLAIDTDGRLLIWHRVRTRNRPTSATSIQLAH